VEKEYIEMCERAVEIQEQWKPQVGDCFVQVYTNREQSGLLFVSEKFDEYETEPDFSDNKYAIWLPRQDQLQKMIGDIPLDLLSSIACFSFTDLRIKNHLISRRFFDTYAFHFTSFEQLWLAFAMKEKYNKVWDGNDWRE